MISGRDRTLPLALVPEPGVRAVSSAIGRPDPLRREIYELEERVHELTLRLREQVEAGYLREVEQRAVLRELAVKSAYISTLESAQGALHAQLSQLNEAHAALAATLVVRETRLGVVEAHAAAIQSRRSYRLMTMIARMLHLPRRVIGRLKRALRRTSPASA